MIFLKNLIFRLVILSSLLSFEIYGQSSMSIMTYNVENLFDSEDDPNTDDETYLPKAIKNSTAHKQKCKKIKNFKFRKDCYKLDWGPETVRQKLKNISEVILSVDRGKGPDILILAEVENKNILDLLNNEYLKSAQYKTVALVEGSDPRGIDVAVLSRFSTSDPEKLFPVDISDRRLGGKIKTRGILKVSLQVSKGKRLSVYAVHLPSQASPTEARIQALNQLNQILAKENNPWVVGGDFNITKHEDQSSDLIEKYLSTNGKVAHRVGCFSCQGTHLYKGKWSFLDMIYFGNKGISIEVSSIDVIGKNKKPQRFNPDLGQGTSDHFPLYARFKVGK